MISEEKARANRAIVHVQMPELVPFIQELHALGMIDGWRDVVYAGPPLPPPRGAISVAEMGPSELEIQRIREGLQRGRRQ